MADETRADELETQDGELLPTREVMSIISTDPSDVLVTEPVPPAQGDEMSIQPVLEERDPGNTLPVERPPAA